MTSGPKLEAEVVHHPDNRLLEVACSVGDVFQTPQWAAFSSMLGQEPYLFRTREDGNVRAQWLIAKSPVARSVKKVTKFVCAGSPIVVGQGDQPLKTLLRKVGEEARHSGVAFMESHWSVMFPGEELLKSEGVEPRANQSYVIDLSPPEGEIHGRFTKDCRYMIRRAEGDKVTISESNLEEVWPFFEQSLVEAGRAAPSHEYFAALFEALSPGRMVRCVVAIHEGKPVSMGIFLVCGPKAVYYEGASNPSETHGSSNLLLWEVMKKLKGEGIKLFDLGGYGRNPGVTRFKKSFGGEELHGFSAFRTFGAQGWLTHKAISILYALKVRHFTS